MQTHSTDYRTLSPKPPRKKTGNYRMLPLLITGLIIAAISLSVTTLTYTLLCYYNNADGNCSAKASLFIYMFCIFLACFIVSFIIRGKSPKPAFLLGTIYYLFGLAMLVASSGWGGINLGGAVEKLLFTLLAILIGYISAFAICFLRSSYRAKRFRKNNMQLKESA